VHNISCYPLEYQFSFLIGESSALEKEPREICSERAEWSDEEIRAIRTVLQRLTTIRILNATDAEDIVQDTLLTMIAKRPGLELQKGLLVWTVGILRKKLGNYYRKTQRFAPLSEQDLTAKPESVPASSPELSASFGELQKIVEQSLELLSPGQRQAVELLLEGLDSGEIVKELHPERYQNVINRIHRGRKRLARELAKYGYGPDAVSKITRMKRATGRKPSSGPTAREGGPGGTMLSLSKGG